jgi:3-hydroxybutyryl-CoA dehydrogenase
MIKSICVAGAGTMGSGIALAAALSGYPVILADTNFTVIEKARRSVTENLSFLTSKNKISQTDSEEIFQRITFTSAISDCIADLVIEAIIEDVEAKVALFRQLSAINSPDAIFVSNTSSLSISVLQKDVANPSRFGGMHFFNPAHIMKLVEVVQGDQTSTNVTDELMNVCRQLGKIPVLCKDAPGFIVNRVARHYYLEAMKIVEAEIASPEEVDRIMESSGFKMGPFKLMDLIGLDINLAVSRSLYEALQQPARLKPSSLQEQKVHQGLLGRKTGKGFYSYDK